MGLKEPVQLNAMHPVNSSVYKAMPCGAALCSHNMRLLDCVSRRCVFAEPSVQARAAAIAAFSSQAPGSVTVSSRLLD
jgi:hypothetical protein